MNAFSHDVHYKALGNMIQKKIVNWQLHITAVSCETNTYFGTGLFERIHPSCSQSRSYLNLLSDANGRRAYILWEKSGGKPPRAGSALIHNANDKQYLINYVFLEKKTKESWSFLWNAHKDKTVKRHSI